MSKKSKDPINLVNYFEKILSKIQGHIYWKNLKGEYQWCNELQAIDAGLKHRSEIVGLTDYDMPWYEDAGFLRKIDAEVILARTTIVAEEKSKTASGENIIWLSRKEPFFDDNNELIGIIGISVDITDLKTTQYELEVAKEKAETANQAKSELIANMSHDVRTPLTGILGLIQGLINTADEMQAFLATSKTVSKAKYAELLNEVIALIREDGQLLIGSADELLQLLNEILETMRLESGKVSEKEESFDLKALINHNIELLQSVAHHKELDLLCELDGSLPTYVKGLRNYLDRTLLNLLSNALKFTEKGHVKIKVKLQKKKSAYKLGDKIHVKLMVEDTGIGIPEDKFVTIFEHFSRLTPSYQSIYKGAGLGLYTVKRYVEAMQADIKVESKLNKGSRFIMTLPLEVSDHSDREKSSYRSTKPQVSQPSPVISNQIAKSDAKFSILVVDDNFIAAKSVQANLKRFERCASDIALSGKEAVEMVQAHDYDFIFMDIGLTDTDGFEVTRCIRAMDNPKALQVPIVALTAHARTPEYLEIALKMGMQDMIEKPLTPEKLKDLLEEYVFNPPSGVKENKCITEEVIDWGACLASFAGDEDMVRELVDALRKDLKISLKILTKAYADKDNEILRGELHRVKGGVVYLAVPQLTVALANFHKAVKENPQNGEHMENTFIQLQKAIESYCSVSEALLNKS